MITWSNCLLLDEIPEGLWEVDFFEKKVREKYILYYRRLMANLRRPTPDVRIWIQDVRIWILGIVLILDPHLINSPDFWFDILLYIGLFPKITQKSRIYIYIYILYQSEGVPRTGYFIPAHVGAGAGQVWRILPPAPSGLFFGKSGT